MKITSKLFYTFLKSLLTLYALINTFTYDNQLMITNHILSLLALIAIIFIFEKSNLVYSKRLRVLSHFFAIIYALTLVFGSQLYLHGFISYFDPIIYFKVLFIELFISRLLMFSATKISSYKVPESMNFKRLFGNRWIWIAIFVLFVFVWSIYWMSYYPGIVDIDNTFNFMMYNSKEFTSHHPILHISLIGFLFNLGNRLFSDFNFGISIYILFQICITALCLTWSLRRLYEKLHVSAIFILTAIVIYSGIILPIIPMNVITTTKDMLFSTFLFAFFILNYEMVHSYSTFMKNRINIMLYVLFGFLILALRNNALYALLAYTIVLLIYSRKVQNYKNLLLVMIILGSYSSYSYATQKTLDIKDVDGVKEMSSVPLQQLARTYNRSPQSLNRIEKELILQIVGPYELSRHNPYWSDFVKIYFNQEHFLNNRQVYIELYLKLLAQNPSLFIDSFLENTLFSWYPFAINEPRYTLYDRKIQAADSSLLFITDINSPANADSKLPLLKEFLEKVSHSTIVYRIPVYAQMYSIGFMFWLFLYSIYLSLYRKKWKSIVFNLFVLLYTMTLWLGPVMFIRYFLYFWLLIPLTLHEVFHPQSD